MDKITIGYKATNKDIQCRGFQFELGKWYKHDGDLKMCGSGFHFCEYPSGPWAFYSDEGTRIFKIEARGVLKGDEPGADLKHVASEIRLVEEIFFTGDRNTGYGNTGDRNVGHGNAGDRNVGDRNVGDRNVGHGNAGDRNTGYGNTGDRNVGHGNAGDRNTGYGNTGYGNTGYGNAGDRNTGCGSVGDHHSGDLCHGDAPYFLFNKKADRKTIDRDLIYQLFHLLQGKEPIDPTPFLSLPNASARAIKDLHDAHLAKRKSHNEN